MPSAASETSVFPSASALTSAAKSKAHDKAQATAAFGAAEPSKFSLLLDNPKQTSDREPAPRARHDGKAGRRNDAEPAKTKPGAASTQPSNVQDATQPESQQAPPPADGAAPQDRVASDTAEPTTQPSGTDDQAKTGNTESDAATVATVVAIITVDGAAAPDMTAAVVLPVEAATPADPTAAVVPVEVAPPTPTTPVTTVSPDAAAPIVSTPVVAVPAEPAPVAVPAAPAEGSAGVAASASSENAAAAQPAVPPPQATVAPPPQAAAAPADETIAANLVNAAPVGTAPQAQPTTKPQPAARPQATAKLEAAFKDASSANAKPELGPTSAASPDEGLVRAESTPDQPDQPVQRTVAQVPAAAVDAATDPAARSNEAVNAVRASADAVQTLGLTAPAVHTAAPTQSTAAAVAAAAAAPTPAPAVPVAGLAVEIAAQAHAGKHRFEIRLDPPELGRIDVRLEIDRDGNVNSRLVVDRAETLDLLRRDAAQLERALQQAGLKTADNALEFSLRHQAPHRDDNEALQNAARLVAPDDGTAALDAAQMHYGRRFGLGGGIDIRV